MNVYQCPQCQARVFCGDLAAFRCPQCGFAGGNQMSLFTVGTENDGSIKYLGTFDELKKVLQK